MIQEIGGQSLEKIPTLKRTRRALNLGRAVAARGAHAALAGLEDAHESGEWYLLRHQCGDWGDLDPDDWAANDMSLREGTRILSSYRLPTDEKLWMITKWDRSVATLLLPSDD